MRRQLAERRMQIQFDRLSLVDRITRSVAARHDLSSIFQVVIRSLEDQMPADFVAIGLYSSDEHTVTIAHLGVKTRPIAIGGERGRRLTADKYDERR